MSPLEAIAILAAGLAAGTINTIVGSGSLITFPTLLAFGYPAVVANVSNTIGLVPGSLSGAIGYRRELAGQRGRAIRLGIAATLGGLTGGLLLLVLPAAAFQKIVPILILGSVVLIAIQPRLSRAMGDRRVEGEEHTVPLVRHALPDRDLRRLFRGRAGGDHDGPAGRLPARRPAAPERPEERPGGPDQRRGGRPVHHVRARSPGRRPSSWRSARSWAARSARSSGGACRRAPCASRSWSSGRSPASASCSVEPRVGVPFAGCRTMPSGGLALCLRRRTQTGTLRPSVQRVRWPGLRSQRRSPRRAPPSGG